VTEETVILINVSCHQTRPATKLWRQQFKTCRDTIRTGKNRIEEWKETLHDQSDDGQTKSFFEFLGRDLNDVISAKLMLLFLFNMVM
jgi:hypothetical protein